MQRKFLNNLMLMIFINLLVKPLAIFGIDAEVQNRIGVEEYGMYFSLFNFTYIFNILLDLGITNYNIKYVAQYPQLVKRYMGKIIPLRLLLFFIYVLFSTLLAIGLGYEGRQFVILGIMIFNQFLISIILFLRSYFSGLLMFKIDTLLSILDKSLLILIAGFLLYAPSFGDRFELNWFIGAQTASYLIAVIVAVSLILWKIGIPRIRWSPAFNKVMLKKSFPYALLILLMMLYSRVDAVMIERLHPFGKIQAGIYAQAFRILDAFVMFAMLFTNVLFPIFARLIKEKTSVKPLLESGAKLIYTFAIVSAIGCFFFPGEILHLLYTGNIDQSIIVFQYIILSFVPICTIMLFGTLLTANGSMHTLNVLSFLGLLLNIGMNFYFIQYWGALGAAFATLITQAAIGIFEIFFVWKYFDLQFRMSEFLRYTGMILILLITAILLKNTTEGTMGFLIFIGAGLLFALLFGMIQVKTILQSLKKER